MRYLIAWTSAFLVLAPSFSSADDSKCMLECVSTNMTSEQCRVICDNRQPQNADDFSHTGAIGGYMRGQQHRAEMEQAAAQKQLLEEQIRAQQIENQRREAELRQTFGAGAASATYSEPTSLENQRRAAEISRPVQLIGSMPGGDSSTGSAASVDENVYRDWHAAMQSRKWLFPDFNDVVFAPGVEMSGYMVQCMANSPYAADIAYYLAKRRDEIERIGKMGFFDTAAAIKEIESRVSSPGP
jgi:hypothetical protein